MKAQNTHTKTNQTVCLICGSPAEEGNPEPICNKCYSEGEIRDSFLAEVKC